jgi:hypothetical protein
MISIGPILALSVELITFLPEDRRLGERDCRIICISDCVKPIVEKIRT